MLLTIHQPEHMPWLGFFHKMALADSYVLLDNVQFKVNNFQNRNRIVTRQGEALWLTVPVENKDHLETAIADMKIAPIVNWRKKYWGRIKDNYCKHPYFKTYAEELEALIMKDDNLLVNLNLALIDFFRKVLRIETPMVRASTLSAKGKATELLVNLCQEMKADRYLSGPDGRNYLELSRFDDAGILVEFHEFKHPDYGGLNFQPYLSTLDLVMNHGPESRRFIVTAN